MNSLFPVNLSKKLKTQEDVKKVFKLAYEFSTEDKLLDEEKLLLQGISPESELYWWIRFSNLYYVLKENKMNLVKEAERMIDVCYLIGNEELALSIQSYIDRLKTKMDRGQ